MLWLPQDSMLLARATTKTELYLLNHHQDQREQLQDISHRHICLRSSWIAPRIAQGGECDRRHIPHEKHQDKIAEHHVAVYIELGASYLRSQHRRRPGYILKIAASRPSLYIYPQIGSIIYHEYPRTLDASGISLYDHIMFSPPSRSIWRVWIYLLVYASSATVRLDFASIRSTVL